MSSITKTEVVGPELIDSKISIYEAPHMNYERFVSVYLTIREDGEIKIFNANIPFSKMELKEEQ